MFINGWMDKESVYVYICAVLSRSVVSDSLQPCGLCVAHQVPLSMGILQARLLEWVASPSPGDLPNPGLLHCRWILDHLSHQGTIYIRQLCLFKSLISLTSVSWFSVYKSYIFSFKKFLCCCEWNYFSFIFKLLLVYRNIVHICTSIFFFLF